jgi:hypothetical protein
MKTGTVSFLNFEKAIYLLASAQQLRCSYPLSNYNFGTHALPKDYLK